MHIFAIKKASITRRWQRLNQISQWLTGSASWEKVLLLDQRGDPKNDDGTDDGDTELTEKAAPGDAEQIKEPAAEDTTEETQYTIHDEAVAATFHQLAGAEASQTSKKEWKNNTHNSTI